MGAKRFTDKERLDWLQRTSPRIKAPGWGTLDFEISLNGWSPPYVRRTLRAAIDAAMSAERKASSQLKGKRK